jgi:hypothetical protein
MKLCPDPNEKTVVVCVDVQPGDENLKRPTQLTQKVTVPSIPMSVTVAVTACRGASFFSTICDVVAVVCMS